MRKLNFDYVPLTFISDKQEIKKQIRNTLILIHLFEKYNNPVRLEKLIEGTQYGYNASALQSGKNKFLRISDIYESKVNWSSVPFCNCSDEATYLLKNEDILIARTGGTTGKSFKIDSPPKHSIYAGYLIRIRAKVEVNPDYIYLFLHSFAYWSQIVNLNERNFRPKANAENLKSLILPDCPKIIQDEAVRISNGEKLKGYEELFSEIEKALEDYEKTQQIENLLTDQLTQIENLNQAILQEATQGKLVKQDLKDEPAKELLKRIRVTKEKSGKKEKNILPLTHKEIPFEIPYNWVWCKLNDVVIYSKGKKPNNLSSKQDTKFKIPYIDIAAFEKKRIDQYTDGINCMFCDENNILLVWDGARMGLIGTNAIGAVGSTLVKITHFEVDKTYLLHFLKMNYRFFNTNPKQSGIPHLNGGLFDNLPFPLPPIKEQKRIVIEIEKQLAKTQKLKEYIIANQRATKHLLKALLHQAFEVKKVEIRTDNAKVIELPVLQEQEEKHFVKRKVLATYIINQSLNDSKFGDVKFEKLLHLSDYFAIKRNLGQKYYQQAAGPYDNAFTRTFFQQIETAKWFKRTRNGKQFVFSTAQNHTKSTSTYSFFSSEELERVNGIITYFKKSDYEQPEIISTLYAVWNNRIIKQESITDELLIADFYAWDKQKKKYELTRLKKALQWMRDKSFIPDGWGKVIEKAKSKRG